jgi:hypothetical protein
MGQKRFVTFSAASSGQAVTRAAASPSVPTPAPRAATHSETVPSPTLADFVEGMKKAPVQRGGTK